MNQDINRFRAVVNGTSYTVIGKKSDQHMQAVTKTVNEHLKVICEKMPQLSFEEQLVLLTLNAVSIQFDKQIEMEQLKKEKEELQLQLSKFDALQMAKEKRRSSLSRTSLEQLNVQFEQQEDLLGK